MSLLFPLTLGTLVLVPAALPQEPVKDLVEVRIRDAAELSLLFELASDPDDHFGVSAGGRARIYADDGEQARLRQQGFRLNVVQEDLSAFYEARALADPMLDVVGGSMGGFKTLTEIEAEMDRLANAYPNIVSPKFSLGKSIENRDIWAMRISDNPIVHEPSEPVAWFDALHHAREPMSAESLLCFADLLASNYGADPSYTRMIDSRNIVFVPCVNPDGYEYNRQTNPNGGGMWRKNRRNNGGSFGIDLNRNYGHEWGPQHPGSSGTPSSGTYRGTAPFSEPEAQAIRDALALWPPGHAISAHTYGNLWVYSWGYNTVLTPEDPTFRHYGQLMTANNGFAFGTWWQVLYIANGCSVDWHYAQHGTYSFMPEIGLGSDGFWPAPSRIPALFEAVRPGYEMVTKWSGAWAEADAPVFTEVSGNGDAVLDPGETWDVALPVDNDGIDPLNAQLVLISGTPDITVLTSNASVNVGVRDRGTSSSMRFAIRGAVPGGSAYELDLDLSYEGVTSRETLVVTIGRPRLLSHDDMEIQDFGWTVNDNTNYSWERAVPQLTTDGGETVQPGQDNPAGTGVNCWVTGAAAGSSAGTNDVDGITILTSPIFRLDGFQSAELEYARWYANKGTADDIFTVEISDDGGSSWTTLETTGDDNVWRSLNFQVENFVDLTDRMRLRFTASDSPNNSLVEACLDDLYLRVFSDLPTVGVWGQATPGATLKLFMDGPPSRPYALAYSFKRNNGVTVPGFEGKNYLAGSVKRFRTGATQANGVDEVLLNVPNKSALSGRTAYVQGVFDENGPDAAYSNLVTLAIE